MAGPDESIAFWSEKDKEPMVAEKPTPWPSTAVSRTGPPQYAVLPVLGFAMAVTAKVALTGNPSSGASCACAVVGAKATASPARAARRAEASASFFVVSNRESLVMV
jgi:hypothetical protein